MSFNHLFFLGCPKKNPTRIWFLANCHQTEYQQKASCSEINYYNQQFTQTSTNYFYWLLRLQGWFLSQKRHHRECENIADCEHLSDSVEMNSYFASTEMKKRVNYLEVNTSLLPQLVPWTVFEQVPHWLRLTIIIVRSSAHTWYTWYSWQISNVQTLRPYPSLISFLKGAQFTSQTWLNDYKPTRCMAKGAYKPTGSRKTERISGLKCVIVQTDLPNCVASVKWVLAGTPIKGVKPFSWRGPAMRGIAQTGGFLF